ncbi:type VI secretion system baseplate subunit TssG [Rhodobacterales bacterium]|nr:type VI secretion system baseplate subunit TssG [Rhodobacterales bacterium]
MAAKDRREGDPMSRAKDKETGKTPADTSSSTARDKTVVQFAGAREQVWPEADESDALAETDEAAAPQDLADEAGDETAEIQEEITSDHGTTSLSQGLAPEEAPITDSIVDETTTAASDSAEAFLEPLTDLDATDMQEMVSEAPELSAAPAQADDEFTPPAEPRIEVPVRQQYASLLAALYAKIEKHPGGHDLLAVLRMLEGQTAPSVSTKEAANKNEPAPPRIGKSRRAMEDIARFGQDPSSEFATSTIERAKRDEDGGLVLMERFLGLLGPQGALPSAMTDEAIMRSMRGDDSFPRFLDVFNNRFIQLFYRAWADARPLVQHDRPDDDRFLTYLGANIGIGTSIYRDLDGIDDRLKLLYAGLTSPKVKSAARLKALITGVFGVPVEIDQCVGTWLQLEPDDQLSLGGFGPGGAGQLGRDTIVGARVYSVSDKIRIRIFTRSLEEYRNFLPPTRAKPNPRTEKLFDLIDFYLGLETEYEIELALPKRCASSVQMNRSSSATLGHIGWLKPADASQATDTGMASDDDEMLTDTRFRPVRRHTTVYQ